MADFRIENNGIVFPLFLDIKKAMEQEGKIQFGDDFEINPETSLGQILEVFCYILENSSKQLQSVYSSMWLFNKSGAILTAYASNFGIERIKGKKAYGTLTIEGVAGHIVEKGFQVRNKKGYLFQTVSNVLIDSFGRATVQIEALEIGDEYNTETNQVVEKASGDENITKVYNLDSISSGSYSESDAELRERIQKLFETESDADVNGIRTALLKLSQVDDCRVLENSTNTYDSATRLNPGEIKIIIKGLADQEVAEKVLNTKSAGIVTVGNSVFNVLSESNQNIKIRLQVAKKINIKVKVSNVESISTSNKVLSDTIKSNILEETRKFGLGDYVNYEKIQAAVYQISNQKEAVVEIQKENEGWIKSDIAISDEEYSEILTENIEVIE